MSEEVTQETYARGLLGEEASEIGVMIGKATRFGIDAPGPEAAPYFGMTARQAIELECGDMLAAIELAICAGLIRADVVEGQRQRKLAKLFDTDSRDNLGRRLAPEVQNTRPEALATGMDGGWQGIESAPKDGTRIDVYGHTITYGGGLDRLTGLIRDAVAVTRTPDGGG